MAKLRIPPGRAGRLWLRDRLAVAGRGVGLLERKLRILHGEQDRLRLLARDSEHDWATAWEEARTWLLRASLLGGRHALAQATGRESADVTLTWTSVMGVRYPGDVRCELPEPGPAEILGSSALLHARTTHREAVLAAVRHAANLAALNVVEREIATTRIRARALRRHWIPRLEDELRRVELDLEESERADGVQRRWAAAVARPGEGNPS